MRGCDEPGGAVTALDVIRRTTRDFPGPVLVGFPSGHTTGPCWTLPLGVTVACRHAPHLPLSSRKRPLSDSKRIHLIGVCGTAMATLAALLKSRGHDVQGSDQNVYPPMSDFLVERGHHDVQRLLAGPHHARYRPRGGRQRHLTRQRRARIGARAQDSLLLAARSDSRSLSLGRAVDRRSPARTARPRRHR